MKKAVSGSALSTARVPLCRPYISTEEEKLAAVETLRSGWIIQGDKTAEFERIIAERVEIRHAVALNPGASALAFALKASGIGPGAPSHSFAATANLTVHLGGEPTFADIGAAEKIRRKRSGHPGVPLFSRSIPACPTTRSILLLTA